MKKIIALALSLMLLLGCVSAFAEDAGKETITMLGAFTITLDKLPEGYTLQVIQNNEMEYEANITPSDPARPIYNLRMNFSEEWDGINTLADATEADMQEVRDSFYDVLELDDGDITFEDGKTGEGTPLLIAKGVDGCFASVYTVYMSHEVEVVIYPGVEKEGISEEDINKAIAFLTNVQFTPIEK